MKRKESQVSGAEWMMASMIEESGEAERRPSHMDPQSMWDAWIFSKQWENSLNYFLKHHCVKRDGVGARGWNGNCNSGEDK